MSPKSNELNFWAFVDLGGFDEHPRFWIVPDWWIKNDNFSKFGGGFGSQALSLAFCEATQQSVHVDGGVCAAF